MPRSNDILNFWEMARTSSDKMGLPTWRRDHPITPGSSHTWGYIIKSASAAPLSVASASCGGGSTAAPTSAPTTKPTDAPTERPTRSPTTTPTSAPTTKPTTAPTAKPTNAPTTKPTSAPTTKPTTAPTAKPTNAPTTNPTTAPTTKPTTAPTGGRICPSGTWWRPSPGTTWQWQLTGTLDTTFDVQMYDIDLFDNSAATIANLHAKGRVVICYFSTQYENWRPDANKFTAAVLGSNLDDWPGERYVDIRSALVRQIMTERLDLAASKGCDGVEPDNVDSYANSNGLGLTANDQLDYNKFLANEAHKRSLSIGLKNDLSQINSLVSSFDWHLNEQCNQYKECGDMKPFTDQNKAVFGVDYSGSASTICPAMNNLKYSWLMKDLSLGSKATLCCASAPDGCKPAPYSCVSAASGIADGSESSADPNPDKKESAASSLPASAASIALGLIAVAACVAML